MNKMKRMFVAFSLATLFGALVITSINNKSIFKDTMIKAVTENSLVLSSTNPVVDSQVKTTKGTNLWVKGDSSSGVTWNNGSGKVAIAQNGYIQTLTEIHGIQSVTVSLVSGSLELYHDFAEPSDLSTPMYGVDNLFTVSGTYTYSGILPNRVRLRAASNSVVNSITINFDCTSASMDYNLETLDDGLENLRIDAGTIGKYASTTYVTGDDDVFGNQSSRSLKLTFAGTENNYVSFNTQHAVNAGLLSKVDFTNKVLEFKAKFSSDISNRGLEACVIGNTWKDSGYQLMNSSASGENGWYLFTCDFSHMNFEGINNIIRINVRPKGITSANKATASIVLDGMTYYNASLYSRSAYETPDDGLENLLQDTGWENVFTEYDNVNTYGRTSRNSLALYPGKSGKSAKAKWYVSFMLDADNLFVSTFGSDFSRGLLVFDYKPVNVKNPSTLTLGAYATWDNYVVKDVSGGVQGSDGWYHFEYNLADLGIDEGYNFVRFNIGFDTEDTNVNKAKLYIDNMKHLEIVQEDYTQGLENLYRDTGWEKANVFVDHRFTSSKTSINSMRLTFTDKASDSNKNFVCLNPQGEGINMYMDHGVLEAKFLFGEGFVTRQIRLVLVDSNWKGYRQDFDVTPIGDGWYLFKLDMSQLPANSNYGDKEFDLSLNIIRIGFGFTELDSSNKNDKTVWIDDVFFNGGLVSTSSVTDATIWQAYSTEYVLQDQAAISDREITTSRPLLFKDVRNATDSSQLMIKANKAISSYNFKAGTLYTQNGDRLTPDAFEILIAKYLFVDGDISAEKKNEKNGWPGEGYYPDALVPQAKIIEANENNIASGKEQSIWINCTIPKGQPSGTYQGYGVLTLGSAQIEIPMEVVVKNATLDGSRHSNSMFLLWDDQMMLSEGEERYTAAMRNKYYNFILDRGVNPDHNHDWNSNNYATFAEKFVKHVAYNDLITTYRIPSDLSYDDIYGYMNALVDANIAEWDKGNHVCFLEKAMYAICDEPLQPQDDPNSEAGQRSVQMWNNVKTVQTNFKNAKTACESKLANYPELLAGLRNMRNITTMECEFARVTGGEYKARLNGDWIKKTYYYPNYLNDTYLDTPCPTFHHVSVPSERDTYFNTFNHVWFYGCILPYLPYPSLHLDTKLLGQRLVSWMHYYYGFDGQLYFCVNYNQNEANNGIRDVWTDGDAPGHGYDDGLLVYPGARYNVYGPITTLRLENLRNSYEDYEYFYMLDQNIAAYNANTGSNIISARDLFSSYLSSMFEGGNTLKILPSYSSISFNALRDSILNALEHIY